MQQADAAMPQADLATPQRDADGACLDDRHDFTPANIVDVRPLDAASGPRHAAAIRVAVSYSLRPACDRPGPLQATLVDSAGGVDTVSLLIQYWRSRRSDAACGAAVVGERHVVLSDLVRLTQPTLIVEALNGGSFSPIGVDSPAKGARCSGAGASGSDCLGDCDCDTSTMPLRCVPLGDLMPGGLCAVTCSEDAECPDALPSCGATGVTATCGQSGACAMGGACPIGQACVMEPGGVACRPPSVASFGSSTCTCDADCGGGAICVRRPTPSCRSPRRAAPCSCRGAWCRGRSRDSGTCGAQKRGEDAPGSCAFPCATTSDCPGRGGCGGLECSSDGTCVPNLC